MQDNEAPPQPSRLSLWMQRHGRPNALWVERRPYVAGGLETIIVLETRPMNCSGLVGNRIEIKSDEISQTASRHATNHDVYLRIYDSFVADWTDTGREKLDKWLDYEQREQRDIAEYKRLHKKYAGTVFP